MSDLLEGLGEATPEAPTPIKMRVRETVILRVVGKAVIPFILLFGLYVQFHGDYGPGGGFQAGVIFAAGLILHALIYGLGPPIKVLPPSVAYFCGALGVSLYLGVGFVSKLLAHKIVAPPLPTVNTPVGWLAGRGYRTSALARCRLFRGSVEVHTAQVQPIIGTPALVPVPRKTNSSDMVRIVAAWLRVASGAQAPPSPCSPAPIH